MSLGVEEIREILRAFEGSSWTGMHLRAGGVTVSAGKNSPPPESHTAGYAPAATGPGPAPALPPVSPPVPVAVAPVTPSLTADIDETDLVSVTAPTIGAFWVAPDPGSPPFVQVGSHVEAGDQLAIIEVMKLMNPVVCDVAGEVVAIRARNAEMVEFGQPLFLIRPDE